MTTALRPLPPMHPAADLFPAMADDEFQALVESVREHGQQEPVVMHEGAILDGRHRYRACVELNLTPKTTQWSGECGSPTAFTIAANVARRHLTPSQRAALALDVLPLFEAEAKARRREAGKAAAERQHHPERVVATLPQPNATDQPKARDQAAKATGASARNVSDLKHVKATAPALVDDVRAGRVTVAEAKREVERRETAKATATVQAAIEADPNAARVLAEKRLRAAYAKGWSQFGESVLRLVPEAVANTFTDTDWEDFDRRWARTAKWFEEVRAARPRGLRVVGG